MIMTFLKSTDRRRLVKVLAISFFIVAASGGIMLLFSWGKKHDREVLQRQKECWKAVYVIIEKSPKEKTDWIKQTLTNSKSVLGGVDYCGALDFIKVEEDGN